jgi:hypothetical protein
MFAPRIGTFLKLKTEPPETLGLNGARTCVTQAKKRAQISPKFSAEPRKGLRLNLILMA